MVHRDRGAGEGAQKARGRMRRRYKPNGLLFLLNLNLKQRAKVTPELKLPEQTPPHRPRCHCCSKVDDELPIVAVLLLLLLNNLLLLLVLIVAVLLVLLLLLLLLLLLRKLLLVRFVGLDRRHRVALDSDSTKATCAHIKHEWIVVSFLSRHRRRRLERT